MALTERTEIGKIEVTSTGHVQVRQDAIIERDGVEVSRSYHRHVVSPGDDYSGEEPQVRAICEIAHAPEVIAAYHAMVAE